MITVHRESENSTVLTDVELAFTDSYVDSLVGKQVFRAVNTTTIGASHDESL